MSAPDNGIRTYVLRQGRMTDSQKKALEGEEGRRFLVDFDGKALDWKILFGNDRPVVMEIGFGMGLATWQIAEARQDLNFLGIEVHRPGVGKLLSEMVARDIDNLRLLNHDAVESMEKSVPPASLAGIHLFYPDPWPKKRHHKRRMVRPGLAELIASRLVPGGYFYFVTDIEDYALYALEVLSSTQGLGNKYEGFAERQQWRPETKFEARAKVAGRGHFELLFERR
ncbi:MAG TPA: tRNA (guanosine(46)-N7)-methyltransferase TrmB [Rectinemataceae bacterium]|nr:tRNA (guanosine(46)-N7)-methyltransferase TrmB [Rectinemataceae bacterium]